MHTALQEDVDVIGMSCLSGAHTYHFPKVAELLKEKGVTDILVIGGGIIPEKDVPGLMEKGIAGIFGPGTPIPDIVDFIKKNVKRDKSTRSREA